MALKVIRPNHNSTDAKKEEKRLARNCLQTVATSKLQPGNRVWARLVPSLPFSISSYQTLIGITGQMIIYRQVHADADEVAQLGHRSGVLIAKLARDFSDYAGDFESRT